MPIPQQSDNDWYAPYIVRSVGDDVIVYDLRTQAVSTLTAFAAKVWRAWGAHRTAAAIADALKLDGVYVADLKAVERVLDDLQRAQLIAGSSAPAKKAGFGRRGFLKGWFPVAASAAAAPAVISIVAPSPAYAASAVPCTINAQCGSAKRCFNGVCVAGCTSNSQCSSPTPKCNTTTRQCVECLANSHCSSPTPTCTANTCVGCTSNTQCPSGFVCQNGACQVPSGCSSNSQCGSATPFCNTTTRVCVQCLDDSNCEDGFYPYCVNNECSGAR